MTKPTPTCAKMAVAILLAAGSAALVGLSPGAAGARSLKEISEEVASLKVEVAGLATSYLKAESLAASVSVEKKVTDGELYFRLGDFQRSAVIFLELVDGYADHPAFPNALFMLAESMFNAKDFYGARTRYMEVLEHAGEYSFQKYEQPSLARLLEISMRLEDYEGVEKYFTTLSGSGSTAADAVINYVKGKYFYFREDLDASLSSFQKVGPDDEHYAQSRFFMGVVYTLKKDFQSAAGLFDEITGFEASTPRERRIRDLAKLNLGRVYYETDQLERAAEVYESIPKTSEMFDKALFEVAWVYIKMEDATKAERSLEVLSISNPDSILIPEAKLLRGNLLLRNGEFDAALKVFKDVGKQFGPVKDELDAMFAKHDDPEAYFHEMVAANMDLFDTSTFLPPLALKWISANPVTDRGVQVLEDLTLCGQVLDDNKLIIDKMHVVLDGETKVNAFPLLKSGKSRATQIENRLIQLKKELGVVEEALLPAAALSEYSELKAQRAELDGMLSKLPVSPDQMDAREDEIEEDYKELSRVLIIQERKVDQLQAKIVATELYIEGVLATGVVPLDLPAVKTELANQKLAIQEYRVEIDAIKKLIELGKVKIGVGDVNDKTDEIVRAQYEQLVKEQHALLVKYGVSGSTMSKLEAVYAQIGKVKSGIASFNAKVETMALKKTQELMAELDKEAVKLGGYDTQLVGLDDEAQEVIGDIALMNFLEVKDKFGDLILKADVGIIDVAWSRKEEHRHRVQYLTSERLDKLQMLDDEFSEILKEIEQENDSGELEE
ncbi:MAG: tetratricopeptide repeat protein [Deltaproteobacteria bacterium]|nr:tetratricopeptide repeat protein [Deltaproteobacteria bacterium]